MDQVTGRWNARPLPWLLVPLCVAAGFALALWPIVTVTILFATLAVMSFHSTHRPLLIGLGTFLVFQDPVQVLAGGRSALGMLVKRFDEPLILVAGVLAVFLSRPVRAALRFNGIGLPVAICFGAMIASSIPLINWIAAGVDLVLFAKPFLLFAIGLSVAASTHDRIELFDRALLVMFGCVLFAAVFLVAPQLQDLYAGDLRPPDTRLGFLSAQGFFLGPGTYSWFTAAVFALGYSGYLIYRKSTYLTVAVVSAVFVLLSWRRKSIVAICAMVAISVLVRAARGSRARSIAVLAVVLVLCFTVLAPYVTALWATTVKEYGDSNPYGTARTALYYTSVLIAGDRFPLGTGLASFASHASRLYYSDVYSQYGLARIYGLSVGESDYITDTFWPMVLGEGGILALVAYLWFFSLLGGTAWRTACNPQVSERSKFLGMATLLLLVGSLFESVASHIYGSSLQAALVLIPAGMLWRDAYQRSTH